MDTTTLLPLSDKIESIRKDTISKLTNYLDSNNTSEIKLQLIKNEILKSESEQRSLLRG